MGEAEKWNSAAFASCQNDLQVPQNPETPREWLHQGGQILDGRGLRSGHIAASWACLSPAGMPQTVREGLLAL